MHVRKESEEVLYASDSIVRITDKDVNLLKQKASFNSRERIRLCSHSDYTDQLHEMIIIHSNDVYVPPHKHPGKSESIHIIEGVADLILFYDDGSIYDVLSLGDYRSKRVFYCRMNDSLYHTLLIRSKTFVFHEITNGPFQKGATQFAPWSPDISDVESCMKYLKELNESVSMHLKDKMEEI